MKELDELARLLVEAAAHIIAAPHRIVNWGVKAAKRRSPKALPKWTKTGSKKSPKKAAKIAGKTLADFPLKFEDTDPKWLDKIKRGKNDRLRK